MRPYFLRNRWLLKYFISIPLFIVVILNIQLLSQIKEFNSFQKSSTTQQQQLSLVKSNSSDHSNAAAVGHSSDSPVLVKENEIFRSEKENFRQELQMLVESRNLNPVIRNRHFIDEFLNVKNSRETVRVELAAGVGLNETTSSSSSTTTTTSTYKAPEFIVILVQVHSRLNYLKELISSLNKTRFIDKTLVIFSHDVYDPQMNRLVESIDFCATLQIFYPYSLQLYPNQFPGDHPNDCPKNVKKNLALILKCNNAAFPDSFGNYREAQVVQIKHHWFWKLAYVFEKLNETKNMNNLHVLLLEEDYYLMPDALHVLRKLTEKILSDIDVVSLAIFEKAKQNLDMKKLNKYAKAIWHTSFHNTGLLLARPQWKMIKDCSHAFCTYDDYNWDWTLQHLSQKCFKLPLVAIFPVSSRVIHLGTCGTHHKGKNCDPKENIFKLEKSFEEKKEEFFADNLSIEGINTGIHAIKLPNGGWSDPRDHQLCKLFLDEPIRDNANSSSALSSFALSSTSVTGVTIQL